MLNGYTAWGLLGINCLQKAVKTNRKVQPTLAVPPAGDEVNVAPKGYIGGVCRILQFHLQQLAKVAVWGLVGLEIIMDHSHPRL